MSCLLFAAVLSGYFGLFMLLPPVEAGEPRFTKFPPSKLFVVKGHTAKFVWDYHVDKKDADFDSQSPRWFVYESGNSVTIGYDDAFKNWKFVISSRCPSRLRARVMREQNATLVISNVNMADSGIYGCTLALSSGLSWPKSASQLIVTETPKFASRPSTTTTTIENSSMIINCTAVGRPTPNVTWARVQDGNKITLEEGIGTAILNIRNIKRNQSGIIYECQAVNNPIESPVIVTTAVAVYYKPTIDKASSTINISSWAGNTITLRCKWSSAEPSPTWSWYKPNGNRITNVHSIPSGSEVTVETGQDTDDYGRYKCIANNVVGSDRHNIIVTQLFPPGPPSIDVVGIQPTSAIIIWTTPVNNGGSPVTGYMLMINSKTFYINASINELQLHKEITGLQGETMYDAKVLARNIAGYGKDSSKVFNTTKQASKVNLLPSTDSNVATDVLAACFAVSLLVIVLLVVYIIWKRRHETTPKQDKRNGDEIYDNALELDSSTPKSNDPQLHKESAAKPNKPSHAEKANTSNTSVGRGIPGNSVNIQTAEGYYQQLDPATLQHGTGAAATYEPLRTSPIDLRTEGREEQHAYQPLRNRPTEYQSLQTYSNVNNMSFS